MRSKSTRLARLVALVAAPLALGAIVENLGKQAEANRIEQEKFQREAEAELREQKKEAEALERGFAWLQSPKGRASLRAAIRREQIEQAKHGPQKQQVDPAMWCGIKEESSPVTPE